MKSIFPSFNPDLDQSRGVVIESNQSATQFTGVTEGQQTPDGALAAGGNTDRDTLYIKKLPESRLAKYRRFEEMAQDSTISTILDIHLTNAFSTDIKNGMAVTLQPKSEADAELCKKLQAEVLKPINDNILNWGRSTCIFGANYIRVHAKEKVGITAFEANYYTLPSNIREYHKCGQLAGFTSENLKKKDNSGNVELAEPWTLIPLKLPNWTPSTTKEPVRFGTTQFSLYETIEERIPEETQDYGVSLLEPCFESWCQVREGLSSLQASRKNASHIDRFVSVNTAGLDTGRAAEYINMITDQLRRDKEQANRKIAKSGVQPTVWNSVIPVMGDKGSVTIDTQAVDPNIQHIEDIMFYFKRLCGAAGVEPSMVGFSDTLSGGLGDGGFLRTSIQSALKAHLLRSAAQKFIERAIDIHCAFKYGKVFTDDNRPYSLRFNSMSTAIAAEEETAKETRANYATLVATVLDAIEQGAMGKSETFKTYLYNNILELEPELTKKVLAELKAGAEQAEQAAMTESVKSIIDDTVLDLIINSENKENE
ncbi:phage portal protein [Photobacterium leiognathi]|uniref:portal protein n=1 Tax=Photobacterium leiognathi TaxID=553611 RepID=UPI001EDE816C|nr:portal protein [Photobacterium leiognathi]MCG3884170.1 phage portal protein [Photobacterium leiognathi]